MLARVMLWFADAEKQLSEALRLWKARDRRGALYWGRRAARHSDLAKVVVAQWLMDDAAAAREAVELLEEAAAAGSVEAQQVLAAWYLNGTRVPKDAVKAYELTKRAADAGNLT